ncbi:MAG TPA: alpha/beta hydrolase [Acidimicrobiales bacterium]|nr:alpha/beta hydrolase [Acidimicrobiales bacterium]
MHTTTPARHERIGDLDVWVEERGSGPDVLLIGGLTDPVESWAPQLETISDRYHLIAFDNPGAGRTALTDELTCASMADVAAGVLDAVGVDRAHVCGFSGGAAVSQELALRHPDRVRSLVLQSTWSRPDAYSRSMMKAWRWLATNAPDEESMLEAFFLWVYTARAHEEGMVEQIIKETLEYPHPQSPEAFLAQLRAFGDHDAHDRLPLVTAPALVIAGDEDRGAPPRMGQIVADLIPRARFHVMEGEAHQPFQEVPEEWNALVTAFWDEVDAA